MAILKNLFTGMDGLDRLYVLTALLFQVILIAHFTLRKWHFEKAMRFGLLVYLLGIPAAILSLLQLVNDASWEIWLAGFLYLAWAIFGWWADYASRIPWRNPVHWQVFIPYVILYLAVNMFYWWPLATIHRSLWSVYAVLFVISTVLNVSSHNRRSS